MFFAACFIWREGKVGHPNTRSASDATRSAIRKNHYRITTCITLFALGTFGSGLTGVTFFCRRTRLSL
jgi:hypothetical protein